MEQRSAGEVMASGQDPTQKGVGLGRMIGTRCLSLGPKAGAVLAGVGLCVLVADAVDIVEALFGPLDSGLTEASAIEVVMYLAVLLLRTVGGFFLAAVLVGWLSARRGWLYGLVTALCLSLPQSALALRSLTSIPVGSLGDSGGLLTGWSQAAPALIPLEWFVFGLPLILPFAALPVAAFGGFCGERFRLRRARESDA